MVNRRVFLKIFIALCFAVALITIKVSMNYEDRFKNLSSHVQRKENSGEQTNTDRVSNEKKFNQKIEAISVLETEDFRNEVLKSRVNNSSSKSHVDSGNFEAKDVKRSTAKAHRVVEVVKILKKLTRKFNKSPTKKIFETKSVNTTKESFPTTKRLLTTMSLKTRPVHSDHSNVYMQNIGNYSVYGENNCRRNPDRNILDKLFTRWISMAKESGIEYFLTCGTLLGSFRNGNLIPYDSDMDVLVDRRDFQKIKKHESKRNFTGFENEFHVAVQEDFYKPYEKRRRFTCQGKRTPVYRDHCSFQEPLGRLITENRHLDIYDYAIQGNTIWDPSEGGRTYNKSDIFPLQNCMLMGHKTKCPNRPREFLKKFYGGDLSPLTVCKNGEWVKRSR